MIRLRPATTNEVVTPVAEKAPVVLGLTAQIRTVRPNSSRPRESGRTWSRTVFQEAASRISRSKPTYGVRTLPIRGGLTGAATP